MWEMAHWTPSIGMTELTVVTVIQGFGMGFMFVPLNMTAFATLPMTLRTDGAALMNLMRNIGSAIGVSVTSTVLANSVQILHSQLAQYASPFNRALGVNGPSMMMNPQIPFGLANLNGLIEMRATIQSYANDFMFMALVSAPAIGIVWLMKRPQFVAGAPPPKIEVSE
jgi:DHA2 family multidrug resistance protein